MSVVDGRSRKVTFRGYVTTHDDAATLLHQTGDLAIVRRGVVRSAVMRCPDGCGEVVTINLDPRTGKAWRIYTSLGGLTVFPSVWRDTGCGSHFVLWDDLFYWMDAFESYEHEVNGLDEVEAKVVRSLKKDMLTSFVDLADSIGENPWVVLVACRDLVKKRQAVEGKGRLEDSFARRESSNP